MKCVQEGSDEMKGHCHAAEARTVFIFRADRQEAWRRFQKAVGGNCMRQKGGETVGEKRDKARRPDQRGLGRRSGVKEPWGAGAPLGPGSC